MSHAVADCQLPTMSVPLTSTFTHGCLQLRITPGQKGLAAMTGEVPSWIHFSDREKVRVSNSLLLACSTCLPCCYLTDSTPATVHS